MFIFLEEQIGINSVDFSNILRQGFDLDGKDIDFLINALDKREDTKLAIVSTDTSKDFLDDDSIKKLESLVSETRNMSSYISAYEKLCNSSKNMGVSVGSYDTQDGCFTLNIEKNSEIGITIISNCATDEDYKPAVVLLCVIDVVFLNNDYENVRGMCKDLIESIYCGVFENSL